MNDSFKIEKSINEPVSDVKKHQIPVFMSKVTSRALIITIRIF